MSNVAGSTGIALSGSSNTTCTIPSEIRCHYITDDELENLGNMKSEPVMEIFLLSAGGVIGSALAAYVSFSKFLSPAKAIDGSDMLAILVFVMTFSVAAVSGLLWRQRRKSHENLVDKIRNRPRVSVKVG